MFYLNIQKVRNPNPRPFEYMWPEIYTNQPSIRNVHVIKFLPWQISIKTGKQWYVIYFLFLYGVKTIWECHDPGNTAAMLFTWMTTLCISPCWFSILIISLKLSHPYMLQKDITVSIICTNHTVLIRSSISLITLLFPCCWLWLISTTFQKHLQ